MAHRVVIIGSGFGALFAAKKLKRSPVEITIIAKTTHHLFQPLLYQVATGVLSEGEIAPATREILNNQQNATVILGEVTAIDLERKTVTSQAMPGPLVTPYDTLIVAAGAGQSYFGNDQFATYAPGMKTIDDALELRGRIFGSFELAERETDPAKRQRYLTFVVVGAGPTGVEMAGQIAELCHRSLKKDFRNINTAEAKIYLLDAAPAVLGPFGPELSAKAQKQVEDLGVEVRLNSMVTSVDFDGVTIKDKEGNETHIAAACKVWAAGVQASPLGKMVADQSEAEVDRAGRLLVNPDCTVPGHPEVFVVGDMMALDGLPGVAQVAIQSGRYSAEVINSRLAGKPAPAPFSYFDKGSMATIARFKAVAKIGNMKFAGFVAWVLWLLVHLLFVVGFKNRLTTLIAWTTSFVGKSRAERTVTAQQTMARTWMSELEEVVGPIYPGGVGAEVPKLDLRANSANATPSSTTAPPAT